MDDRRVAIAPTHAIPKLIVVTAASSNHFGALRQMLESLRRLGARVECYDIGLTAEEARALPRWPGFFYHKFDYAAYPAYLNVAVNAGEYAWKPVIVADVIDRARAAGDASDVLWADAGCFFHALQPDRGPDRGQRRVVGADVGGRDAGVDAPADVRVSRRGSRARTASGAMRTRRSWASPSAARRRPPARRSIGEIVLPWKTCALAKDCIAPAGIVPQEPPPGSGGAVVSGPSGGIPVRRGHAARTGRPDEMRSVVLPLHRIRRARLRVCSNLPVVTTSHSSSPQCVVKPITKPSAISRGQQP